MPNITFDTVLVLVVFIVPGLVANRVYHLKIPTNRSEPEKLSLDFLAYSTFNFLICYPLLPYFLTTQRADWDIWRVIGGGMFALFVVPTGLALGYYYLRIRYLHKWVGLDHPIPRGYDYYLKHHGEFFILFHLKNGKMLGGYFGANSYASTFPHEPEFYVESVWHVDEHGEFLEVVEGTDGAVFRQADWERIEFLKVKREDSSGQASAEGHAGVSKTTGGQNRTGEPGTAGFDGSYTGPTDTSAGGIRDGTTENPENKPTHET